MKERDILKVPRIIIATSTIGALALTGSIPTVVALPETENPDNGITNGPCIKTAHLSLLPNTETENSNLQGFIKQEGLLEHRCRTTIRDITVFADPMLTIPLSPGEGLAKGTNVTVNGYLLNQITPSVGTVEGWGVKVVGDDGIIRQGWIPDGAFQ